MREMTDWCERTQLHVALLRGLPEMVKVMPDVEDLVDMCFDSLVRIRREEAPCVSACFSLQSIDMMTRSVVFKRKTSFFNQWHKLKVCGETCGAQAITV